MQENDYVHQGGIAQHRAERPMGDTSSRTDQNLQRDNGDGGAIQVHHECLRYTVL